ILHMSHGAGRYLRHVGGEPSHNLLALVHPSLRVELRAAVLQAIKTDGAIDSRLAPLRHEGREAHVRIAARPFKDQEWDKKLVLLIFEEAERPVVSVESGPLDESQDRTLETLENEVQSLTDQLQQTIEHSDTSTEELKASNEDLQAINEELRSATEELETSKEELQSMNEELITVNCELKTKVDETVKINDDLQNLISSSDIATIFVDRCMRVKWYTPKAATLFNLIAADNGRSLMDITHRLEYAGMMADTAEAFESLRLVEREVRSTDNRCYLARILPYRSAEDRIDGAVLNFVDITGRRLAEERLREGLERLRLVAESTTDFAIITMDKSGRITGWNRAAEFMFGYEASQVEGQLADIIFTPEDRAAGVPAQELRKALEEGHADDDRWHVRKDGSRFFCSGVVHPMVDGDLLGYAKIARDLTDKRMQEDEQQSHLQRTQASNVLKDEFNAIMSHELRHPLNLIQLNADLLARMPGVAASPRAAKAVQAIRRSVRSQAQIIADLLDLSRVRTGKLRLNRAPLKLHEVAAAIVEAVGPQARAGQIALRAQGLEHSDQDALVLY
ncbi:MAG: PAS domain-containing protein, partial [Pollutimonas bauzanensis]